MLQSIAANQSLALGYSFLPLLLLLIIILFKIHYKKTYISKILEFNVLIVTLDIGIYKKCPSLIFVFECFKFC